MVQPLRPLRALQVSARDESDAKKRKRLALIQRNRAIGIARRTQEQPPPPAAPVPVGGVPVLPSPLPELLPEEEAPQGGPDIGGWFGSGILENVMEGAGTVLAPLEPVLQPLHTAAKATAGAAVDIAARAAPGTTFGREYGGLVEKHYGEARQEGLDPVRAGFVARERALEEQKFPKYVQGALELVFDPLNVLSWGAVGLGRKGVTAAVQAAGERITREAALGNRLALTAKQVSGTRYVTNLRKPAEILGKLDIPDALGSLALQAERIRWIGGPLASVMKKANPAPWLAKTNVGRALLVHMFHRSEIPGQVRAALAELDQQFVNLNRSLGKYGHAIDENGFVSEGFIQKPWLKGEFGTPGARTDRHFLSASADWTAEAPRLGSPYSSAAPKGYLYKMPDNLPREVADEMDSFMYEYQRIFAEGGSLAKINGVKFEEIALEMKGSVYIHRYVEELADIAPEALGRTRRQGFGAKPGPVKQRAVASQQIDEAIKEWGVGYTASPIKNAEVYLTAMYRAAADQQLVNRLTGYAARALSKTPAVAAVRARAKAQAKGLGDTKSLTKTVDAAAQGAHGSRVRVNTIKKAEKVLGRSLSIKLKRANGLEDGAARRRALRDVRDEIKAEGAVAKKTLEATRSEVKAKVQKWGKAKEGEAWVRDVPHLKELLFTPDEAQKIATALNIGDINAFVHVSEAAARLGDALRVVKAGFDFGAPFLQGLPALANDLARTPAALVPVKLTERGFPLALKRPQLVTPGARWSKATYLHYKSFWDEGVQRNYLGNNADVFREMIREGGVPISASASDFYVGLQQDALIPRVLTTIEKGGLPGRAAERVLRGGLKRFERSFDTFGDVIRAETWKAMSGTARKSPGGLQELGAFIRNSTGAFNSYSVGIAAPQQSVERAWMFFSPRYTRSSLALVADVLKGGLRGKEARNAMASMLAVGTGMNYAITKALGQEPNLDPTKSDFMTVKIAGHNIGPGSFFVSFLRFASKVAARSVDTGMGTFFDPNTRDNPMLSFLRGRSAPMGGLAWDIAQGSDFLGNKLESPTDWAAHLGKQTLPFALETAIFDGGFGPVLLPELSGMRTHPVSDREVRDDIREQLAFNEYDGKEWKDLNKLQRKRLEEDEALQEVTQSVRQLRVARGEEVDALVDEFYAERDVIMQVWLDEIDEGIAALQAGVFNEPGGIDLPRFREKTLADATLIRRSAMRRINTSERFAPVRAYFTDLARQEIGGPEAPEDVAYGEYIEQITDPELETSVGIDFKELDRRVAEFRARWGEGVYGYVQERLEQGKDIHPLVQRFYQGRDQFRYYWDGVDEQVLRSRRYDESMIRALFEEWEYATRQRREELEDANPAFSGFIKTRGRVRSALRRRDPALDAFLYRWGFNNTLLAPENRGREYELRDPDYMRLAPGIRELDAEEGAA